MRRPLHLLAIGLVLCLLAAAFAVPSLYVPGVGVILLVLAAIVSVRVSARGADVTLELASAGAEEGTVVATTVRVAGWGLMLGEASVQVLPGGPWRRLPFRGGAAALRLRAGRRGPLAVGPAKVRFGDPFGICDAEVRSPVCELLVLPRVERIASESLERILRSDRSRAHPDEGVGVDGLRPYRPGAPASRIHWLTVARTGALVERRPEEGMGRRGVLIVLDARSPRSGEDLDAAVRAAASLCVAIASVDGCSLLLPGGGSAVTVHPDMTAWPSLHERLALVRAGEAPAWRAERGPLVVWVGAREPGSRERDGGAALTVSPVPAGGAPVLLDVCGCALQPVRGVPAGVR